MLNVQNLTNTLSRMQLPELYNYATVNKNDPYIVSLALSIANQKKQADIAKRGQAGMTPQPKVVDQALAQMMAAAPQQQMLPEDTGIGQLPAQNMQRMAGGGIVAFDDGGYTFGAEAEYGGLSPMQIAPLTPAQLARIKLEKERQKNMAMARAEGANMRPTPVTDPRLLGATPPAQTVGTLPLPPGTQPPLPPASPAAPKPVAAAKPATPATPAPAPIDPMAGIKALDTKPMTAAEAKEQAAALSDSTALRKQLEANEKFTTDAYAKLLGDYDKKIAAMPEAYKGYEERLQKEEAEAATDKNKALGMAIFQAGLGMMSGTSQYAFENIGKGALAGLENYQSALKDLKKAQRERDKAFADIEAARLAEKRGDIKAHTELQAKGIEALGTAKNRTVEGIAKIFDVDTRTATGIFETRFRENLANERTMYTSAVDIGKQRMADDAARQRDIANNAAALQRAQIQANAPGAEERILSNPALFNKKMELLTATTGMRGDDALVASYIRNPTALAALEVTDPQLAAQIKQKIKMQMISPINLPADAPVRP